MDVKNDENDIKLYSKSSASKDSA